MLVLLKRSSAKLIVKFLPNAVDLQNKIQKMVIRRKLIKFLQYVSVLQEKNHQRIERKVPLEIEGKT